MDTTTYLLVYCSLQYWVDIEPQICATQTIIQQNVPTWMHCIMYSSWERPKYLSATSSKPCLEYGCVDANSSCNSTCSWGIRVKSLISSLAIVSLGREEPLFYGVPGQEWHLIVLIPDLCLLYFACYCIINWYANDRHQLIRNTHVQIHAGAIKN